MSQTIKPDKCELCHTTFTGGILGGHFISTFTSVYGDGNKSATGEHLLCGACYSRVMDTMRDIRLRRLDNERKFEREVDKSWEAKE